jgi:hypothetical protein
MSKGRKGKSFFVILFHVCTFFPAPPTLLSARGSKVTELVNRYKVFPGGEPESG